MATTVPGVRREPVRNGAARAPTVGGGSPAAAFRVGRARAEAARAVPRSLAALEQWLTIPSVSGSAAHRQHVESSAVWVATRLRRLTAKVELVRGPQGPVVLARVPAAPTARRGRPAVAVYGHLDVRPAGQGWSTPPFGPTRRGDRLFARGASDDKGQLMAHLAALEAWAAVGGPPLDVALVVDGAEEIGSPDLARLLEAPARWRPHLRGVGALVCSDSRMVAAGRPGLTVSLRAMLELQVGLTVQRPPLHAGRFGGAVVDPALLLAARLARVARVLERLGSTAGQAAPPPFASRGALSVTSLFADGGPGAIPNAARATVDVRLPPRSDPLVVRRHLETWLAEPRRPGVQVQIHQRASSAGGVFDLPAPLRAAVDRAVLDGFGRPPAAVASGASVPGVTLLAAKLGCPSILLGLGPVDDQAHAPDEHLNLQEWPLSVDTAVLLLASIAEVLHR